MRMLQGMTAATDDVDARLTVHTVRAHDLDEQTPARLPKSLRGSACDAAVLEGRHDPAMVRDLARRVPLVSCAFLYDPVAHDAVLADNLEGVRMVVDHLMPLGHRRLAWVGEHHDATFSEQRRAGFIEGCLRHGLLPPREDLMGRSIFHGRDDIDGRVLREAVQRGVTAFVCVNDRVAGLVIRSLEEAGLSVPADASVTGFDAMHIADLQARRITSIDPQFVEMGRACIDLVMRRLRQPASRPLRVSVSGELVIGNSSGPVAT